MHHRPGRRTDLSWCWSRLLLGHVRPTGWCASGARTGPTFQRQGTRPDTHFGSDPVPVPRPHQYERYTPLSCCVHGVGTPTLQHGPHPSLRHHCLVRGGIRARPLCRFRCCVPGRLLHPGGAAVCGREDPGGQTGRGGQPAPRGRPPLSGPLAGYRHRGKCGGGHRRAVSRGLPRLSPGNGLRLPGGEALPIQGQGHRLGRQGQPRQRRRAGGNRRERHRPPDPGPVPEGEGPGTIPTRRPGPLCRHPPGPVLSDVDRPRDRGLPLRCPAHP